MIKDVVVALAAIVTASAAVIGLSTWRRQLHGATRHEVARKAMRALRGVHTALINARDMLATVDAIRYNVAQGKPIPPESGRFDPEEAERIVLDRFWRAYAILRQDTEEASDLFGEEARAKVVEVFKLISVFQLRISLRVDGDVKPPHATAEKDLYGDKLRSAIDAAVECF